MDAWELSKENIQPLASGRQMSSLQAALTPIHDEILQKQNQYEQRLRLYTGNDELEIWHEYILWAEQYFPQGGKLGNYDKLIVCCVKHFQNESKYYNDERFVSVLLKYIKQFTNKVEVFHQLVGRGIGRKSARFYCEYAWQLEQLGNYQKANEILTQAINQGAEPKETLLSMQKSIAYKLVTKINSSEGGESLSSTFIPEVMENRQVLTGLHPVGKKHRAPTNRTGSSIDPSVGKTVKQQPPPKKNNALSTKFEIYNDEGKNEQTALTNNLKNSTSSSKMHSGIVTRLDEQFKENEQKAGKWRHVKVTNGEKKVIPIPVGQAMSKRPGFDIHADENEISSGTPKLVSGASSVLKLKTQSSKSQKTAFDPPTPNKVSMYNHALVYGGAKEMSFEEIRAASWSLKQKLFQEAQELAREKVEQEYRQAFEALKIEKDLLKQQLQLASSSSSQYSSAKTTPESLTSSRLKNKGDVSDSHSASSLFRDSNHSIKAGAKKLSPNKSVTHDVFNLWNATIGTRSKNSTFEDSSKTHHQTPESAPKESLNVQQKPESKLAFEIYEDNESPIKKQVENRNPAANFVVFEDPKIELPQERKEKGFQVYCDEPEDDFKENESPCDVNQFKKKNQPSGILVESQTVHFVPLEEQEVSEDDDDDDDDEEEELAQPLEPTKSEYYNTLYHDECAALSKMSSTPFPFTKETHGIPEFPIDGFTIALESAKSMPEHTEQREFIPPKSKATKKNTFGEQKTNQISMGVALSPIMEGSREQSKSSSSSGCTTSHTNGSTFGMKSMTKSNYFKGPNNSAVPVPLSETKDEDQEPIKTKLTSGDVFETLAYRDILRLSGGPIDKMPGYSSYNLPLPSVTVASTLRLKGATFAIVSCAGKGANASVYEAVDQEDSKTVALKLNRAPNEWEFYITTELQKRIQKLQSPTDVHEAVLSYNKGHFFTNGSILITDYSPMGSLLDFINQLKKNNLQFVESLIFYFTWELMQVLDQVHKCKIIHADVKPDNILLMSVPNSSCLTFKKVTCLRLIDFGQAIDLDMYQEDVRFNKAVRTSGFQCPEMLENRLWTFQPDLYGLLACVHVMLFSQYMEIVKNKKTNLWETKSKIKRYWKRDFWNKFFDTFLNIPSCEEIPSLTPFIEEIESFFSHSMYVSQFETYLNKLRNKKLEK